MFLKFSDNDGRHTFQLFALMYIEIIHWMKCNACGHANYTVKLILHLSKCRKTE